MSLLEDEHKSLEIDFEKGLVLHTFEENINHAHLGSWYNNNIQYMIEADVFHQDLKNLKS